MRYLLVFAAAVFAGPAVTRSEPAVQQGAITWWALNARLAAEGSMGTIGGGEHSISTKVGWRCAVSPQSPNGARETACRMGDHEVAFSVQCDVTRKEDHVQMRFSNRSGRQKDFVEVGCRQQSGSPH